MVDDTGVTLTLDKSAERIIALYGAYNELLLAWTRAACWWRRTVADAICRAAGRQVPIVAGLDTTLQPVPCTHPEGAGAGAVAPQHL